jgi:uncharacterized membrane protein
MLYREKVRRSVVKSVTFRALVMIADGFIIFALTNSYKIAISVILLSNLSSTIIYFFHERAWDKVSWGKQRK